MIQALAPHNIKKDGHPDRSKRNLAQRRASTNSSCHSCEREIPALLTLMANAVSKKAVAEEVKVA
jgi:hypothetical protein